MNLSRLAAISALVLVPVAALAAAGPIEGLVDSVLKCADVDDGTARLTCYDGLIPSFRAAKAAPAPAQPVVAATPAQPVAAATQAKPQTDDRAWYDPDRIFGVSPQAQMRPEQFGSESLPPPPPRPPKPGEQPAPEALDSITATVTEYAFNVHGKVIVFLDNGQIWQQIPSDEVKPLFSKQSKNVVEISRGALGSYQLSLNGQAMGMKVKRIK